MADQQPPLLSDLVSQLDAPSDRRTFITRAGLLSVTIPGVGAALSACSPNGVLSDSTKARAGEAHDTGAHTATDTGAAHSRIHNSDSRLDSAVLKGEHRAANSATGTATQG